MPGESCPPQVPVGHLTEGNPTPNGAGGSRGDMEEFMRGHLRELNSQTESRELIGELSQKLADHTSRVRELVQVPELTEREVSL